MAGDWAGSKRSDDLALRFDGVRLLPITVSLPVVMDADEVLTASLAFFFAQSCDLRESSAARSLSSTRHVPR